MKIRMFFCFIVVLVALISCSDDQSARKKRSDPDVTHLGDKWNITSVEYNLIDQSTSGQTFKSGTIANAGAFYFDADKGSFEFDIEGYHKEDVFSYSDDTGQLTITDIEQGISGGMVSQNLLVMSGSKTDTEIALDGTITKQSMTGQFVLTVNFTLVKE